MIEPRTATLRGAGIDLTFTDNEDDQAPHEAYLTDLKGWYGGVGVSASAQQRVLGHGLFAEAAVRTGRALTLKGTLLFRSQELRSVADRLLSGLLWNGEYGELEVTIGSQTLTSTVRLDGEISHEYLGTHGIIVQIPLSAADPFLYGPAQTFQVYPAGQGVGLEYPLFSAASGRGDMLQNAPVNLGGAELINGPENIKGLKTNRQFASLGGAWEIPTTPGKWYRQTTWARASKEGSHAAIRTTRVSGTASSPYLFWPKPVPTEWTKYVDTIRALPGETGFRLDLWTNHSGGDVRDATQEIAVLLEEVTPVLTFGKANPNTRIGVTNQGNATSYPTITVKGDLPGGFRLKSGSKTIEYPNAVWSNAPVTIECGEGAVYVGGMDQTYRTTKRQWFEIEPNEQINVTIHSLSPGDGWAEVTQRDTYI